LRVEEGKPHRLGQAYGMFPLNENLTLNFFLSIKTIKTLN